MYYANRHYFSEADAIDRIVRVLMADAPTDIEKFRLISVVNDLPQREFDVVRTPLERNAFQDSVLNVISNADISYPSLQNPLLEKENPERSPRLSWSLFPFFRQELFDPNNPFAI